ncbi:uncharacterized protein EI90DRAFT_3293574 [Cantharellus anzutake]|uniref:uncharacterized protein n=1 Tax=Cantharellus anzutake TaxID=1750568 RepID=UPI00190413E1|nr:uncharacterized protein EI90DRAFT_3293574 [Cantharellus anzutake]KAF8317038.1 hypothetical protein EI90DRAFT_3293574 [Cantharellus anzutake]
MSHVRSLSTSGSSIAAISPHDLYNNAKLQRATATIDELTEALAHFTSTNSSVEDDLLRTDPECRCNHAESSNGRNCDTVRAWRKDRSQLEEKLVLCAEIGQALLEKHEAYAADHSSIQYNTDERSNNLERSNERLLSRLANTLKAKESSDARYAQATLNLEVAESSNRTLLREVQDARAVITRLSAHVTRSAGWEEKVMALEEQRDEILQERDAEIGRAKSSEAKVSSLSDKCASLQTEVYKLLDQLSEQRSPPRDISEQLIHEARAKLEAMYRSLEKAHTSDRVELTKILESLVSANESLSHDNIELQNLLAEARTEQRALTEEVQEYRATASSGCAVESLLRAHSPSPSSPLGQFSHRLTPVLGPRASSRRAGEPWGSTSLASSPPPYHLGFMGNSPPRTRNLALPHHIHRGIRRSSRSPCGRDDGAQPVSPRLTPHRSASPDGSAGFCNTRANPTDHPDNSQASLTDEGFSGSQAEDMDSIFCGIPRKRSLRLLSRSRGVQTDHEYTQFIPHHPARIPPVLPMKGTIRKLRPSIQPTPPPVLPSPDCQADVETLTARLKRQHIAGGDVGHLSRTTIRSIVNDAGNLRSHLKGVLEMEHHDMTRKDLKNMLRFSKDVFTELGKLRSTVNEIILDPSAAAGLGTPTDHSQEKSATMGWIAPISKLFSASTEASTPNAQVRRNAVAIPSSSGSPKRRVPARTAPKLAAAVSSSPATVNVEFSSSRANRVVSSTAEFPTRSLAGGGISTLPSTPTITTAPGFRTRRDDLFGIFAGASQSFTDSGESWVVLPGKSSKGNKIRPAQSTADFGSPLATPKGPSRRKRVPRNVDAVIDSMSQRSVILEHSAADFEEETDEVGDDNRDAYPNPRHTSVTRLVTPAGLALSSPPHSADPETTSFGAYDRQSAMRTLTHKVSSLASSYYGTSSLGNASIPGSSSSGTGIKTELTQRNTPQSPPPRPTPGKAANKHRAPSAQLSLNEAASASPIRISGLIPGLSAWGRALDHTEGTCERQIAGGIGNEKGSEGWGEPYAASFFEFRIS